MIKKLLENLCFIETSENIYKKQYQNHNNYEIIIDFKKSKISYRDDDKTTVERVEDKKIQLGDLTTSNFKKDNHPNTQENFVVLECVDRLLTKGYLPNDIHLERKWKLGHGASGGKADINIYGKDEKTLFIIECKTWGKEFEKEKAKMELHGGQLFTYLQQDQNAQYISLYASKFEEQITFTNLIIKINDRKEDLEKSNKEIEEENIKLYINAKNKKEFYEVWKESFNLYFHFNGIFDSDVNAYSIELKPLKRKDLKELIDSSGTFKKFAEILRHNNISDNANAFNRILSLFLCKIVDEEKNDGEVLEFQVKEDESYEDIQDRLQHLYQKGMKEHLKENIIYYSEKELQNIIDMYPKQTPLEEIAKMFKELKYYTNNEFAFKEVHNEELFKQNARVLNEVVKLLQNYKFKYSSKRQVLGDFFELMLTHGVKQSEGQFFTPIPIVRYIISCLNYPEFVKNKINNNEKEFLPKVLDYACGAGHFLTESIDEIQEILKTINPKTTNKGLIENLEDYKRNTKWAEQYIYGIEKDYRLARTSQISCFLNGDGDANIIFGDGLEENERLKLNNKKFDMVIANPPYSVKAFKNYLRVNEKQYSLYPYLTEKSGEIETLFIERTKQLLNTDGLAGIILPTSILSNSGTYQKTRELILEYFEIKGITELGNKTFIATTTSTVILFLKRRNDNFLKDRIYISNDLFNEEQRPRDMDFIDSYKLLDKFITFREFDKDNYKEFLDGNINNALSKTEMFEDYKNNFDKSTDIKKLNTQKSFKSLTKTKQNKELSERFFEYCRSIEKYKFLYFMLCIKQGKFRGDENYYTFQKTTIVNSGSGVEEQKEFLGYEIVKKSGIKMINKGKLFNSKNINDTTKTNYYVNQSINDKIINKIDENLLTNIKQLDLVDMINFDKVIFDKQIRPNANKKIKFDTKYNLERLGENIKFFPKSKRPANSGLTKGKFPFFTSSQIQNKWLDVADYTEQSIVIGDGGVSSIFISDKFSVSDHNFILKSNNELKLITKYIYYFYKNNFYFILEGLTGSGLQNISKAYLESLKIPVPPKNIQQKLINDMEALEKNENINSNLISKKQQEIIAKINNNSFTVKALKTFATLNPPKIIKNLNDNTLVTFLDMQAVSNNGFIEKPIIKTLGVTKKGFTFFQNDDVIMAKITPSMENGKGAYIDKMKNNLGFGSTEFHTIRAINNESIGKYIYYLLKQKEFRGDASKNMTGASGHKRVPKEYVENYKFLIPDVKIQKKIIEEIEIIENDIVELAKENEQLQIQKENVLKKYL
jgi:type I restriction enzyme M protein